MSAHETHEAFERQRANAVHELPVFAPYAVVCFSGGDSVSIVEEQVPALEKHWSAVIDGSRPACLLECRDPWGSRVTIAVTDRIVAINRVTPHSTLEYNMHIEAMTQWSMREFQSRVPTTGRPGSAGFAP